jgi:hypothetical protein
MIEKFVEDTLNVFEILNVPKMQIEKPVKMASRAILVH